MGSRSQRPCLGASCPMVLVGNVYKTTTQFTSSGASCYFLCRQCPLTAEVQVCRCSSGDKHSILANCFFLTRCGLAVVNVPLIFFSPVSIPPVCFCPVLFLFNPYHGPVPISCLFAGLAHQALLHSSPTPCRGTETELSCLSWILHQGNAAEGSPD